MASPVFDSAAGSASTGTSASVSHSLGSASGNNRCVLIWCFSRGNSEGDSAITSCTYNGSSSGVTLVATYRTEAGSNVRVTLYRVMDANLPASSGSYTVACSSSAGQDTGIAAISHNGVDQADPIGGEAQVARTSAVDPINDSVTTDTAESIVVDGVAANLVSGSATTTQSGQVERDDQTVGELTQLVSTRPAATTGSWTLGWNFSASPNRSQHYLVELHGIAAGPVVVDSSQGNNGGTGTTVTVSHSFSAGSNKKLLVFAGGENGDTADNDVTSVTYNGVALQKVTNEVVIQGSGTFRNNLSAWYLDDANFPGTPGAYNVVATFSSVPAWGIVHVVELDNAAQGAPEAWATSQVTTGTTISTNVTTANDNSLIVGSVESGQSGTYSPTSGQTELEETDAGGSNNAQVTGSELIASAGATSMSWSHTATFNRGVQIVLAVGEAGTELELTNAPFFGAVF